MTVLCAKLRAKNELSLWKWNNKCNDNNWRAWLSVLCYFSQFGCGTNWIFALLYTIHIFVFLWGICVMDTLAAQYDRVCLSLGANQDQSHVSRHNVWLRYELDLTWLLPSLWYWACAWHMWGLEEIGGAEDFREQNHTAFFSGATLPSVDQSLAQS